MHTIYFFKNCELKIFNFYDKFVICIYVLLSRSYIFLSTCIVEIEGFCSSRVVFCINNHVNKINEQRCTIYICTKHQLCVRNKNILQNKYYREKHEIFITSIWNTWGGNNFKNIYRNMVWLQVAIQTIQKNIAKKI